jgi:DNA polymerase III subunit delta
VIELKAAYLIHGDDHGAVIERRVRLRRLAESEGGAANVEMLEGEACTPGGVALALQTMTFAMGQRVIVVDGVERWKDTEVQELLAPAMEDMPPDTTLALFACEEGRYKAPAAIHKAVKAAKGQIVQEATVKPWELPNWAREQASRMGLALNAAATKALVAQVGERQQRLLRELEKLALEVGANPAGPVQHSVTARDIEQRAAHSAQSRVFSLADALVGGDARGATLSYLHLRAQGERLSGLMYLMASRLREAMAVAVRLGEGESAAQIKRGLRMPPRVADRFISDVASTGPERLQHALSVLADLELDSRGGAVLNRSRSATAALQEDTLALQAIQAIAV